MRSLSMWSASAWFVCMVAGCAREVPPTHPASPMPTASPAPVPAPAGTAAAPDATAPAEAGAAASGVAVGPATSTPAPSAVLALPLGARQDAAGTSVAQGELAPGATLVVPWRLWLTSRGGGPIARVHVASRAQPAPVTRIALVEDAQANGTRFGPLALASFRVPFALPAEPLRVTATAEYQGGSRFRIELAPTRGGTPIVLELTYVKVPADQLTLRVTGPDGRAVEVAPEPQP